ncbi:PKD domain-containing protein [Candidatus Bathyarchaeota archaeon]|nr:MAG: PKD domain-containing protein [Candidatus Bathyarchaeota archaeon]
MNHRFKLARSFALLLLCTVSLGPTVLAVWTGPRIEIPKTFLEAPPYMISYSGLGPTTISLNWTESVGLVFDGYVLQNSTDGSSWATFANIPDKTNTSIYISAQVPGATNWWQVIVYDPLSQYSNPLKITQPSIASLSYTRQTATSVQLNWDNNAAYGGFVSFASYQLMEAVNGGPFVPAAKITDVSSLGDVVTGLAPSTRYSFYLNTTDQCNGCSNARPSSTFSNTVTISTPGPLAASAQATPATVDAGEPANFVCTGAGGAPPYTYSWNFGDGSSGTGASPSHTYNDPGTMNPVCTVTDSFGTIANSKPIKYAVYIDPSIMSFRATPASPDLGQRVTFVVSTSGGNGSLTYAYARLPTGCSSANSSSFSCTPTSSGIYEVMVTVSDQGGETAMSTVRVSIGPSRVLGLPEAMGLAVIFGAILGIGAVAILAVVIAIRPKKGTQDKLQRDA